MMLSSTLSLSLHWKWTKVIFLIDCFKRRVDGDVSLTGFPVKKSTWFDCLFTQQLLVGFQAVAIPAHCTGMTMKELTANSVPLLWCMHHAVLTVVSTVEPFESSQPKRKCPWSTTSGDPQSN